MKGKVKKYVDERGFGFITVMGKEVDVFFHISSMMDRTVERVYEGQLVEFKMRDTPRGGEAVNVALI